MWKFFTAVLIATAHITSYAADGPTVSMLGTKAEAEHVTLVDLETGSILLDDEFANFSIVMRIFAGDTDLYIRKGSYNSAIRRSVDDTIHSTGAINFTLVGSPRDAYLVWLPKISAGAYRDFEISGEFWPQDPLSAEYRLEFYGIEWRFDPYQGPTHTFSLGDEYHTPYVMIDKSSVVPEPAGIFFFVLGIILFITCRRSR